MKTVARVVILALAGVAQGAVVQAAPDKRDLAAAELFGQGKFREAAEIYAQLRDESRNAKYSCNLGLCYAKMGYPDPAIETIRQCLSNATLSPATRADYESLVAKLEAQRPAAGAPAPAPTPTQTDVGLVPVPLESAPGATGVPITAAPPVPWAVPGAPNPVPGYGDPAAPPAYPDPNAAYYPPPGTPPAPATPASTESKADSGGKKWRLPYGSYVTGAVGAVSTAMGIALVLHGQAIQQEIDGSLAMSADRELLDNDLSRTKTGTVAAFVVGGLGIGAAIVWAVLAPSSTPAEQARAPQSKLTFLLAPDRVGVAGRF